MNNKNIDWRKALYMTLSKPNAGLSRGAIDAIMGKFDEISPLHGAEKAFAMLNEAYGSRDSETELKELHCAYAPAISYSLPMSKTGQILQDSLEQANKQTISFSPQERIKRAVSNFNNSILKCGATLRNERGFFSNILSEDELRSLQMNVPKLSRKLELQSWASLKERLSSE